MPVDRGVGADLARQLVTLYTDLETRIAASIARQLRSDIDAPDWATAKLAALQTLRRQIQQLLTQIEQDSTGLVEQILIIAALRGGTGALQDMARLGTRGAPRGPHIGRLVDLADRIAHLRARADLDEALRVLPGAPAVVRLQTALVTQLRGAHLRIIRWTDDAYRDVVGTAVATVQLGTQTRLQAAQVAWDRLIGQGITGFVDRSGRNWELASYVEMATRTNVAQAATQAHLDQLHNAGIDLVVVSDAPQECPLCRPWEGKILTIAGPPGAHTVQAEHGIHDGVMVNVHVAGSVSEAIAAGLMHPNCRHSLSAVLPGVTKPATHTADPEGDKARQLQRHIERQIRHWKLRADAPIDPAAAKPADVKVAAWQQRMRDHLDNHPELRRQRHREQIGTAR